MIRWPAALAWPRVHLGLIWNRGVIVRCRRLDNLHDFTFGRGLADYHENSAAMVLQIVMTRLRLFTNEWFLDYREGTPYRTMVLGHGTRDIFSRAIRNRISSTPGVLSILSFDAEIEPEARVVIVNAQIETVYGQAVLDAARIESIPMYGR